MSEARREPIANVAKRYKVWRRILPPLLLALIAIVVFLSLTRGGSGVAVAALHNINPWSADIVLQLRLPRIVLALAVGAILGITGAALQGIFRNPLADPSLIGVSAGASLGAALAIAFLSQWTISTTMVISVQILLAFAFALAAVAVVYLLAGVDPSGGGRSVVSMLLAGIAITALVGATTSVLKYFVDDQQLRQVSLWQMGSLEAHSWPAVLWVVLVGVLSTAVVLRQHDSLNAFLLGEANARYMGVAVAQLKQQIIVTVALATATTVALVGVIGFVGLLAPHSVRLLVGPSHQYLLICSALSGALMLLTADLLARSLLPPIILPVGVITALVGAPVFLWLLVAGKGAYQWRT